jgi:hypothetical protein
MSHILRGTVAAACCALAATLAHSLPASTVEHVGINAERGDPARWYIPADTPQRRYETQVQEARAALAEELKECRALQADRAPCVAEAKARHRHDMDEARSSLLESTGAPVRVR